jgi:predicted Holliday junction resolvase-like endonuclease
MPEGLILITFAVFVLISFATIGLLIKKVFELREQLEELASSKTSLAVKYGKSVEQLLPFARSMPFTAQNFRFIGSPIDGIAFEEDRIIFCEFKLGDAPLNSKQREIKKLVKEKRVEWLEVRA